MAIYKVTATITLEFDSDEVTWIGNEEDAQTEMLEYLNSGPSPYEFDLDVEVN